MIVAVILYLMNSYRALFVLIYLLDRQSGLLHRFRDRKGVLHLSQTGAKCLFDAANKTLIKCPILPNMPFSPCTLIILITLITLITSSYKRKFTFIQLTCCIHSLSNQLSVMPAPLPKESPSLRPSCTIVFS